MTSKYSLHFRTNYYHNFAVSEEFLKDLEIYKRLNWSAQYFLDQWNSNIGTYAAGTIRRYNHIFHVQFASGCSLGQIKELLISDDFQLDLSFRKSANLPAIVIIDFKKGN